MGTQGLYRPVRRLNRRGREDDRLVPGLQGLGVFETVLVSLLEPVRNPASTRHLIAMLFESLPHSSDLVLVGPC